jgi:hypothetical protein
VSTRRYIPNETWPRHQKPYWNEVLGDARSAGWTLNYIDAPHRFGEVFCPGGDDGTRHSFMMDKTARGGETISRGARKLIRTCRHGSAKAGVKVRERQWECEQLLGEAERLIGTADAGLALAEAKEALWAEIERIEVQLETAAANLREILREEEDVLLAVIDAEDVPDSESISATLDDAMTALTTSESVATALKLRRPHLAKPILVRIHQAHIRIDELRGRLTALM